MDLDELRAAYKEVSAEIEARELGLVELKIRKMHLSQLMTRELFQTANRRPAMSLERWAEVTAAGVMAAVRKG